LSEHLHVTRRIVTLRGSFGHGMIVILAIISIGIPALVVAATLTKWPVVGSNAKRREPRRHKRWEGSSE